MRLDWIFRKYFSANSITCIKFTKFDKKSAILLRKQRDVRETNKKYNFLLVNIHIGCSANSLPFLFHKFWTVQLHVNFIWTPPELKMFCKAAAAYYVVPRYNLGLKLEVRIFHTSAQKYILRGETITNSQCWLALIKHGYEITGTLFSRNQLNLALNNGKLSLLHYSSKKILFT